MPKTKNDTIRYTTVLPVEQVKELKKMAREERIASVNQGIRLAIDNFVKEQNKLIYKQKMREAAEDKDYMNRIAETQADFALLDDEEMSSW